MYTKKIIKVREDEFIKRISLHDYINIVKGDGYEEYEKRGLPPNLGSVVEIIEDQEGGSEEFAMSGDHGNNPTTNEVQVAILYIDIKSGTNVKGILGQLSLAPYVLMAHLNRTKDGMTIISLLPDGRQPGPIEMEALCQTIEGLLQLEVNRVKTKDFSIALPISFDPDAYVNWAALEFGLSDANGINPQAGNPEFVNPAQPPIIDELSYLDEEMDDIDAASGNDGNVANEAISSNRDMDFSSAPTFPGALYGELPNFLVDVTNTGEDDIEKSLALLTAIVGFSSIMPNVRLFYDGDNSPNLFAIIVANAGAGKSKVNNVKKLFDPLHQKLVDECSKQKAVYNAQKQEFEMCKDCTDPPLIPDCKGLYIPEDITHAALIDKLASKDQYNFLFSTEADSLNRTSGNETFNKSDLFRKIFHHESISYARRTGDAEKIIIDPRLSMLLTGTPGALKMYVKGVEDGMISRSFYFGFGTNCFKWKSQQSASKIKAANDIDILSKEVLKIFKFIKNRDIVFEFTADQLLKFDDFFESIVANLDINDDQYYVASVNRHGLMCKRIAAILTVIEAYEANNSSNLLICSDKTLNTCLEMISTLLEHSKIVYSSIEKRPYTPLVDKTQTLYNALPDEFSARESYDLAKKILGISERRTRDYLKELVKLQKIKKVDQKNYQKTEIGTKASAENGVTIAKDITTAGTSAAAVAKPPKNLYSLSNTEDNV